MKKKNIIIIVLALVIVAAIVLTVVLCSGADSGKQSVKGSKSDPALEPGTAYLDKDKQTSVTVGVAESDGDREEEDVDGPAASQSSSSSSAPQPTATPVPMPEDPEKCSYELFCALSPEQKDEFLNSFESYDAFYEWLIAAQEEYKTQHPDVEIGPGGVIDLSEIAP